MTYAIIGFGAVGQALAQAFARKGIDVTVATTRPPEALTDAATAIGPSVRPAALAEAVTADTVILAVPFGKVREIAAAAPDWSGKTVIDATNAFGTPLTDFGGVTASAVNAQAFSDARLTRSFAIGLALQRGHDFATRYVGPMVLARGICTIAMHRSTRGHSKSFLGQS